MIVKRELLNKLKDFSLNSYESKLWTALLSRGVSTAGELSDISNVPRSRSYDVLESLERKGFIVMKLGKPIKYIAVPPEEVLDRVKKGILEGANKQAQILEGLKRSEVISELNVLHNKGLDLVEPTDLTGAIKGRTNLYNHLSAAIKNADKTVSILTTETGAQRKLEALKGVMQKAKDKGVKIRIAAPFSKNSAIAKELSKVAQVRQVIGIDARFCVTDKKSVTFMALEDKSTHPNYDFGMWVNTKFLATAFENLFDKLWGSKQLK